MNVPRFLSHFKDREKVNISLAALAKQGNPAILKRHGDKENISRGMDTNLDIDPEEDSGSITHTPFNIYPRRVLPPGSTYRLRPSKKLYTDDLLFADAPCTKKEFINVWAFAYIVLGFFAIPSIEKDPDEIYYEHDFCLAFAYLYFGIDYDKLLNVA